MAYILVGIALFFLVLWWDVESDYKKWKKGIPIKHTKELIIRCLLLAPSSFFLILGNFSLIGIPLAILMQGAWYWELFDGFYNRKRKLPWRFNSSVDPDDSKLDAFLYHLSTTKQTLLKWGLIIITTLLFALI